MIAVCDSDMDTLNTVADETVCACHAIGLICEVMIFNTVEELRKEYAKGKWYDIIYMDMYMQGKKGLQLSREIRSTNTNTILIYLAKHSKYLDGIFDIEIFRMIEKPVKRETVQRVFRQAAARVGANRVFFDFNYNRLHYRVSLQEIMYFESRDRVIIVKMLMKEMKFYGRMRDVEEEVAESGRTFLRIHQSYLVNYQYIRWIKSRKVILLNGEELQMSEERRKKIRDKFFTYWQDEN